MHHLHCFPNTSHLLWICAVCIHKICSSDIDKIQGLNPDPGKHAAHRLRSYLARQDQGLTRKNARGLAKGLTAGNAKTAGIRSHEHSQTPPLHWRTCMPCHGHHLRCSAENQHRSVRMCRMLELATTGHKVTGPRQVSSCPHQDKSSRVHVTLQRYPSVSTWCASVPRKHTGMSLQVKPVLKRG